MEPYVIICDSCTARLKVTNEALIGQRLACPKCQSMINVVAPEGFVPSQERAAKESSAEDSLSGNFEDIDSLLANAQSDDLGSKQRRPKPKSKLNSPPPSQAATGTKRSTKTPKSASANPPTPEALAPGHQTPMMSGAQWDTESTKQKKRILQIVMLSVMGLVALGIGLWAIIGGGSNNVPVANNDDANLGIVQDDTSAIPAADAAPTSEPDESVATTSLPDETGVSEAPTQTTDSSDSPVPTPPSATALEPSPLVDDSARTSAPPPLPSSQAPSQLAGPTEPKNPLTPQSPPTADLQSQTDQDNSDGPLIASTENSLGSLSKILKGQGTSLKEIEDIAEIQRERALIGTPTYWIERPDNKPIQLNRQLGAELSGWKLDNVPLIDAIGDLEMLSDIPISIDPALFRDDSFDILQPVSLQIETITFKVALETLLKDAGLVWKPAWSGLRISSPASFDVVAKSYAQSFCTDEKSTVRLKELIIAVTGINNWDDEDQYELDVSSDSVTVSHLQKHQETVADLLTKLNAAAAYKSDPAALKQTLRPLALKAEVALAASPNLKTINPYRRTMRIGSLLRHVRNTTKLKTIIDWESLTAQGWFPNTRMPGRLNEPTNRALMNQLGHAMELTSVVIGTDTIMLTTFEKAGKQSDIEVYSVGDVIDNKMTPQQLDQLMTETLGVDQLTPPNATVIYFAECKCLVANAPQIIQRQISSIVGELAAP